MLKKPTAGSEPWIDPDDAPELDDGFFSRAALYDGPKLIRRGRPPAAAPKQQVTLRLDRDVIRRLRASGPGWQTRANEVLNQWLDQVESRRAG
ncbi:MAG: BrnA antitoxin family protein [Proteobacteria bacterium]|nr:BrnA antitoxin family protein [Pseudomonadota bacterium]